MTANSAVLKSVKHCRRKARTSVFQPSLNPVQWGSTDCKSACRSRRKDGAEKVRDPSSRTGLSCSNCIVPNSAAKSSLFSPKLSEYSAARSHKSLRTRSSQAIVTNPHWSRRWEMGTERWWVSCLVAPKPFLPKILRSKSPRADSSLSMSLAVRVLTSKADRKASFTKLN